MSLSQPPERLNRLPTSLLQSQHRLKQLRTNPSMLHVKLERLRASLRQNLLRLVGLLKNLIQPHARLEIILLFQLLAKLT